MWLNDMFALSLSCVSFFHCHCHCHCHCRAQIVRTPYSRNNLIAFVRLLSIPTQVLRGCVHIMQIQMVSLGKEGGGMGREAGMWGERSGSVRCVWWSGKEGIGWVCGVRGVDRLGVWGGVGGRDQCGVGWEGGISWVCEMGGRLLVEVGRKEWVGKIYSFHQ